VTNAGWIEGNATDGLRKCLVDEFSDLYVFHLRGNQRTSGELSRREGGKIFGSGSRAPIAISVFVKNPAAIEHGRIHFHDIGEYLDQKEKLAIIRDFASIDGVTRSKGWKRVTPDENNDWLDQVDRSFDKFILIGDKRRKDEPLIFEDFSNGLKTQRDAWAYNFSSEKLMINMGRMIENYNAAVDKLGGHSIAEIKKAVDYNSKRISWSDHLFAGVKRGKRATVENGIATQSLYRPFERSWAFYSAQFNDRRGQMPRIFPAAAAENLVIQVSGVGASAGFAALMSNILPNLHTVDSGQCFPLYLYEETRPEEGLFAIHDGKTCLTRRDAITDAGLAHFKAAYPGETFSKEDLFYYIYGLLHAPDYRDRFKNNLAKALPRIPAVRTFKDFEAFCDAGRKLGDLHVNFETAEPYLVAFKEGDHRLINEAQDEPKKFYRVKKMKFGGKGKDKDRTIVVYNDRITIQNIPLEAYDYVVNGKPALEWVMERQAVKQDKPSGIINDANDYATETIGDPAYPLKLFQRVITVSLETMKIVQSLPVLDID
jgi:predicted helicase